MFSFHSPSDFQTFLFFFLGIFRGNTAEIKFHLIAVDLDWISNKNNRLILFARAATVKKGFIMVEMT
jgi:hypothetical protein